MTQRNVDGNERTVRRYLDTAGEQLGHAQAAAGSVPVPLLEASTKLGARHSIVILGSTKRQSAEPCLAVPDVIIQSLANASIMNASSRIPY